MNRVFEICHKNENVTYAFGGESRSKAILNYLDEIGENRSELVNYRATVARDYNGNPISTENSGLLRMEELMPKGYTTWWDCPHCNRQDCFDYVPEDKFSCRNCGFVDKIPFCD
jgi:rubrerythrin